MKTRNQIHPKAMVHLSEHFYIHFLICSLSITKDIYTCLAEVNAVLICFFLLYFPFPLSQKGDMQFLKCPSLSVTATTRLAHKKPLSRLNGNLRKDLSPTWQSNSFKSWNSNLWSGLHCFLAKRNCGLLW